MGYAVDFEAMVKGRPVVILEFVQWLKNTASDPRFANIRDYDACGRRSLCRSSIRLGKNAAGNRNCALRRRRFSTAYVSATTTSMVRGDRSPRCGAVFDEDDAMQYTVRQGSSMQRTLKGRHTPPVNPYDEGSRGSGGGSGDSGGRLRLTGTLSTVHPEDVQASDQGGRWSWPHRLPSNLDIPKLEPNDDLPPPSVEVNDALPLSLLPSSVDDSHGEGGEVKWAPREEGGAVDSRVRSNFWEQELVVRHPTVPPGFSLCIDLMPAVGSSNQDHHGRFAGGAVEALGVDDNNDVAEGKHAVRPGSNTHTAIVKVFISAVDAGYGDEHHTRDSVFPSSIWPEAVAVPQQGIAHAGKVEGRCVSDDGGARPREEENRSSKREPNVAGLVHGHSQQPDGRRRIIQGVEKGDINNTDWRTGRDFQPVPPPFRRQQRKRPHDADEEALSNDSRYKPRPRLWDGKPAVLEHQNQLRRARDVGPHRGQSEHVWPTEGGMGAAARVDRARLQMPEVRQRDSPRRPANVNVAKPLARGRGRAGRRLAEGSQEVGGGSVGRLGRGEGLGHARGGHEGDEEYIADKENSGDRAKREGFQSRSIGKQGYAHGPKQVSPQQRNPPNTDDPRRDRSRPRETPTNRMTSVKPKPSRHTPIRPSDRGEGGEKGFSARSPQNVSTTRNPPSNNNSAKTGERMRTKEGGRAVSRSKMNKAGTETRASCARLPGINSGKVKGREKHEKEEEMDGGSPSKRDNTMPIERRSEPSGGGTGKQNGLSERRSASEASPPERAVVEIDFVHCPLCTRKFGGKRAAQKHIIMCATNAGAKVSDFLYVIGPK